MKSTQKCLIECNAIVEALGQGKQSILIRNYQNTLNEFVLYPSSEYLDNENYLDSFQNKYHSFVENNSQHKEEDNEGEVKYFATVEAEIKKPASSMDALSEYHIWTKDHVNNYINSDHVYVWLLRIYELKEPFMTGRTNGMVYANAYKDIPVDDLEPVLSDAEFDKLKNALE